ncbi:MAG TPA: WD40 repeat domain-containing protein [Gemmataceae bacterium]|jgi:WD40 repeat protein
MFAARLWGWTTFLVVAFTLPGWGQEPSRQSRPAKARVDLYGDPLPRGVIARLGTVRFRHDGAVHAVAFSEDGKLLAASDDGWNMIVIWERATGRKLREIRVAGNGQLPPNHLHFSPDGKRLYGFTLHGGFPRRDMALYAWDVETGAVAKGVPRPPVDARALGYSPKAQEIILLHKEAEIVRWDIEKGKELGRYPKPEGFLSAAARVGTLLLVPQFDDRSSVAMWDAAQKKRLWSVEATRDKNDLLPMAFSADGKLFAVEAPPRSISVYESITGKTVRRLQGDVGQIYNSLAISPDARTIAGFNRDESLRLWDLESGRQRAKIPAIQSAWCTNVFFAPDSKSFAIGGPNNAHSVMLWKTASGEPITPFTGHTSPVSSVSFSPDGRMAATSSRLRDDPVVRLWDTQTARLLRSLEAPDGGGVSAVAFSPDGGTLAACSWSNERKVRLWDAATGRERHALAGHQGGCTCVAFSTDGKRLASGDAYYNRMGRNYEGRLCIWDVKGGKLIREIRGTRGTIQRVLFTRDGRHVLAAANGVHIYDADMGQLVGKPFQAKSRVSGLALSADGRLLATADGRGPVRLWELATRREIPTSLRGPNGNDVDLTPDGRILAASDPEEGIVLLHWPSGETVGKLADEAGIRARLVFSPDGRRLATAENDESSALIWDVADMVNRPLPAVAKPAEADLRRWWADLRDDDPGKAYKAVWRLAAVPHHALPFLAASLQPVKVPEPAIVARLIDDLDNSKFQVRERASRELERLGEAVADDLRKAKKDGISLEQRQRLDLLLAKLTNLSPGPEQLRGLRAVAALEQIGDSEARKVLTRLASGAAGARLTREAKAALECLQQAER